MARKFLISRIALAIAMGGGMAAAVVAPTTAYAAKGGSFSKPFQAAAAPIDKLLTEKKEDPAVKAAADKAHAATTDAAKAAAKAEVDAALGGILAKLSASGAVATTGMDKVKQGEMTRSVGVMMNDLKMQHDGLVMMYESGALQPETSGQVVFLAGVTSYQSGDYADSAKWFKIANDAGYKDQQGLLPALLADSYKRSGNTTAALDMVKTEIANAKATGTKPAETSIRSALQAAYDAKSLQDSAEYGAMLAQSYPSADSWNVAISIVRQLASLPKQQNVDIMRLMFATGSMKDRRDYIEYLENADPRGYPGEAVKIMNDGLAKGKLSAADVPDKANATSRIAADKASIASSETAANKPGASVASVTSTADVLLSYDEYARAETLYAKAIGMPGVDANKVALRLGMAQAMQGKTADAQANLAKVSGPLAAVAKLWSAYAATKGSAPA
ncbi:hypothetical protein [Novosphingobium colocasiae]|uniref:Tetratricopeptide repeat protein n=1 Tax=Novosphingobium colocasiae TaxID=1256513 RepID=A0A918UES7_9SPHN|nr:hypothetical protein [Novosphingobium colocasiae]GGY97247.1 hypothetical protein GCM10011614_10310 [Novosphingobium colocasiae]